MIQVAYDVDDGYSYFASVSDAQHIDNSVAGRSCSLDRLSTEIGVDLGHHTRRVPHPHERRPVDPRKALFQ